MGQVTISGQSVPHYRGLRMSADRYLGLPQDGYRYELVDGVVSMSPSLSFRHQAIVAEITYQIQAFLVHRPVGKVAVEVDAKLRDDLVYRPDVVFLSADKAARCQEQIREAPDLVVEIISPDSRNYDTKTKRDDYEAAGVGEYWLIDPQERTFLFLVFRSGTFSEALAGPTHYASTVLSGFELDLDRVRSYF